jgi:uncharacterized protein (TIGR02145 family)
MKKLYKASRLWLVVGLFALNTNCSKDDDTNTNGGGGETPKRYSCVEGNCEENANGNFSSLTSCQAICVPANACDNIPPGTVCNPTTGRIWMESNLGASRVANASNDAAAYGDLYQWGRGSDGHQLRSSGTVSVLATSPQPGHSDFILATLTPFDWLTPPTNSLWQGVNGENNPCPSGYRLPTIAEWEQEVDTWSSEDAAGAFDSPLKLTTAYSRKRTDGDIDNSVDHGGYWSSTVSGGNARVLYFNDQITTAGGDSRAIGYSVRCIMD